MILVGIIVMFINIQQDCQCKPQSFEFVQDLKILAALFQIDDDL